MEVSALLNSIPAVFNFIKNIPSMLLSCLDGFPDSIKSILIVVFVLIIAIRLLELVF